MRAVSLSTGTTGMKMPAFRKWADLPRCQSATTSVPYSGKNRARSASSISWVSISTICFDMVLRLQLCFKFFQPRLPVFVAVPLAERLRENRKGKGCQPLRPLYNDPVAADPLKRPLHARCFQLEIVHFVIRLPQQQVGGIVLFKDGKEQP